MSDNNQDENDIKLLIKTRKEYQQKLNAIFKKYFITYMKDMYIDSLRDFQKQLFKIPSWSEEKINKELKNFIKYTVRKFDLTEEDLTKILNMIFGLYIKTITNLFDPIEVRVPKFNVFWYKCLKRIAKFLYENPILIKTKNDNDKISLGIDESIKYTIQKFIPFKEIINVKHHSIDKYNFDEKYSSHEENHDFQRNQDNLQIHKIDDDNKLKYIGSDEFDNEYYHSNSEKEEDELIKNKNENDEKQIKIPKFLFNKKKNYNNYKLKKQEL